MSPPLTVELVRSAERWEELDPEAELDDLAEVLDVLEWVRLLALAAGERLELELARVRLLLGRLLLLRLLLLLLLLVVLLRRTFETLRVPAIRSTFLW